MRTDRNVCSFPGVILFIDNSLQNMLLMQLLRSAASLGTADILTIISVSEVNWMGGGQGGPRNVEGADQGELLSG